jgi:hypothetical protein
MVRNNGNNMIVKVFVLNTAISKYKLFIYHIIDKSTADLGY